MLKLVLLFLVLHNSLQDEKPEPPWSLNKECELSKDELPLDCKEYQDFMCLLNSETIFDLKEETCSDKNIITDEAFKLRHQFYETYYEKITICQNKTTKEEFRSCMVELRTDMKTKINELITTHLTNFINSKQCSTINKDKCE